MTRTFCDRCLKEGPVEPVHYSIVHYHSQAPAFRHQAELCIQCLFDLAAVYQTMANNFLPKKENNA